VLAGRIRGVSQVSVHKQLSRGPIFKPVTFPRLLPFLSLWSHGTTKLKMGEPFIAHHICHFLDISLENPPVRRFFIIFLLFSNKKRQEGREEKERTGAKTKGDAILLLGFENRAWFGRSSVATTYSLACCVACRPSTYALYPLLLKRPITVVW